MEKIWRCLFLGFIFGITGCAHISTKNDQEKIRSEVRSVFSDMNEAAIKLDEEKFASYFSPDVIWVFNGQVGQGLEGLRNMHSGWNIIRDIYLEVSNPPPFIEVITPEAAVITSTREWTINMKNGGQKKVKAAFTALVKKRGNVWKVVQGHESTIQK